MSEDKTTNSLKALEEFIEKGTPPDTVAVEYSNKAKVTTIFRWKDGTTLFFEYEVRAYLYTLARFLDFWGTTLPGTELTFMEEGDGEDGKK